ncbi:hypothetical protein AVEN_1790-1 [Araneus ventricosus]|uniref:Uncharacterized protein n=1 Tax=Araneus ventricosus TaxID=182803 RepID=A0A4Y2NYJ5_ARAVE|nr:hypothetical protein AVEN_1790-1 [Araneus ventricosus]
MRFAGSERADRPAKLATKKDLIDLNFNKSGSQLKTEGKIQMLNSWQKGWRDWTKGRWTKYFFEDVQTKRLQRNFYLTQILFTGHGAFKAHQARFFDKDNKCFCRKAVGTILLTHKECEIWKNQRKSRGFQAAWIWN